jgi:hypothetical protein
MYLDFFLFCAQGAFLADAIFVLHMDIDLLMETKEVQILRIC